MDGNLGCQNNKAKVRFKISDTSLRSGNRKFTNDSVNGFFHSQKLPLFFNIFICFKGILLSARGVLITQKHLVILWLSRSWSYLISKLWSRFPLVISNQNLSGYCLPEEAKPPVSFLCDHYHHRHSRRVKCYSCESRLWHQIFSVTHFPNSPVNGTESRSWKCKTHLFWSNIKNNPLLVGSLETKSSFKETSRPTDERHVSL